MKESAPSPSPLRGDTSPPEGGEEERARLEPVLCGHPYGAGEEGWSALASNSPGLPLHPKGGEVSPRSGDGEGASKRPRRRPNSTSRARKFRQAGNQAEALLWIELKARRLGGFHFVRQLPIGPYFADFACRAAKLVVEVDGSQHAGSDHDRRRDACIRAQGYSVIRFWNVDVLQQRTAVCETVLAALDGRLSDNVVAHDLRFTSAAEANLP